MSRGGDRYDEECCAEHDGTIKSFERLTFKLDKLEDYKDLFKPNAKNVVRAGKISAGILGGAAIIGPAAENGVRFSGVFSNLMRAAARTGMGSVMASKNVKALAIRGSGYINIAKPRMFEELVEDIENQIIVHEQYPGRRKMGTTRILLMANKAGFLPTRHYTSGTFEHADEVSGERLAKEFNVKSRGCFACTIPCSRIYTIKKGPYKGLHGEGPEYESLGSFTSRIGNPNLELALKANDLCNQLGLDILSTTGAIGWAMELYENKLISIEETGGLELNWGNPESIIELIYQIANREGFGAILAEGSKKAAEKLGKGLEYTVQVKGMDLIMADPRGLKGFGLGYAVASRGGDHLRSEPFIELSDDPEIGKRMFGESGATMRMADTGKGKLIHYFEDWCAVIDSLEPCKNIMQNMMLLEFPRAAYAYSVTTGIKITSDEIKQAGERIVNIERMFGVREGITRKDDTLPRRFIDTPLIKGNSSGTVLNLEKMLDEYYSSRGWNQSTGQPSSEILKKLSLGFTISHIQ